MSQGMDKKASRRAGCWGAQRGNHFRVSQRPECSLAEGDYGSGKGQH